MIKKNRVDLILFLVVGSALGLIYFQIFSAPFLPWDDDYNISLNPYFLQGQWLELWNHTYFGMYIPVTNTLWQVLFNWGGGETWPFRVFNFSLHAFNTFLVYRLAQNWFSKNNFKPTWLLGIAPLFFALHPLQVDAVAWISGGRDLLATFFGLLSLVFFFKYETRKGFWLAGLFFVLSLLSKPQVAALPVVIFLLSLVQTPSLWKKNALKMLSWCVPVLIISVITYITQKEILLPAVEFLQRPLVVFDSLGFYLSHIAWPINLTVDYGRSPTYLLGHLDQLWPTALIFVSSLIFLFFTCRRSKKWPALILFLAWIACLLPVLGLVSFAFQDISTVANHYIYFSMAIFSLFLVELLSFWAPPKMTPSFAILGGLICLTAFYSTLSWQRQQTWQSPKIFFETMLLRNPDSHSALMGLAQYYGDEEKNPAKSLPLLERARLQKPKDVLVISNIATTLAQLHRYKESADLEAWLFEPEFQRWMPKRNVDSANFLNALGSAMAHLGRVDLALLYFCQAGVMNPLRLGYDQNTEMVLARLRPGNPQITCPRFSSFDEFIQTAAVVRYNQTKESK